MNPVPPSARMLANGIQLPEPAEPVGSYTQARLEGEFVFVTGQLAFVDGEIVHPGVLGREVGVHEGVYAARVAALNAVAAAAHVAGGVDAISGVVQAVGYLSCTVDYPELSAVMNGASNVLVEIFGDSGVHTRSTVGVQTLPLRSPVEIQIVCALGVR